MTSTESLSLAHTHPCTIISCIGDFTGWRYDDMKNDHIAQHYSAAHFSSSHSRKKTQGGKYIFQYFLSQLYCRVIILYINCGHQEAAINMRGIETAFKSTMTFYFHFRNSRSHKLCLYYGAAVLTTHFTRSDACQWCPWSVNHLPSSSVISPYSVYVVSEILCTAM